MYKLRFTLNQAGLALEYYKDSAWLCAGLFSPADIENHGGLSLIKSKILYAITERYTLESPGEYKDDSGITVLCV